MKLKSFFALLLLSCSSNLSVFGYADCCRGFNSFYAGVAGGIATQMSRATFFNASAIPTFAAPEVLVNDSRVKVYDIEPWGEIFGGWGRQFDCYYWGWRLGVNFSRFRPKASLEFADLDRFDEGDAYLTDTLKTQLWVAEFTFDFRPGWVFCSETMFFGILGGAVNKQRLVGNSFLTKGPGIGGTVNNEVHFSKQRRATGLRVGFGLEYLFRKCWSIQMSYVYTRFWKLHRHESSIYLDDTGGPPIHRSFDFEVQASRQVTSIGLARYF